MIRRQIPGTEESLPVIGLGTYEVFDVGGSSSEIESRLEIVRALVDAGGSVIDSSPMYNRAEEVVGNVLAVGRLRDRCFLATKVWTTGEAAGSRQMQRSAELLRADVIDLMQVHNRRDLATHLPTIREWRDQGRIRYDGVTDYREIAMDAMAGIMRDYRPRFIQINYSIGEPAAERRLLPLAAELGIAVLVNRPFMAGRLFTALRGHSLPDWALDFSASWGQFLLKFIISHPAVTCVIPATSRLEHMVDNAGAGFGPLPDAQQRRRMAAFVRSI